MAIQETHRDELPYGSLDVVLFAEVRRILSELTDETVLGELNRMLGEQMDKECLLKAEVFFLGGPASG